jgi:hypothetical protein
MKERRIHLASVFSKWIPRDLEDCGPNVPGTKLIWMIVTFLAASQVEIISRITDMSLSILLPAQIPSVSASLKPITSFSTHDMNTTIRYFGVYPYHSNKRQ